MAILKRLHLSKVIIKHFFWGGGGEQGGYFLTVLFYTAFFLFSSILYSFVAVDIKVLTPVYVCYRIIPSFKTPFVYSAVCLHLLPPPYVPPTPTPPTPLTLAAPVSPLSDVSAQPQCHHWAMPRLSPMSIERCLGSAPCPLSDALGRESSLLTSKQGVLSRNKARSCYEFVPFFIVFERVGHVFQWFLSVGRAVITKNAWGWVVLYRISWGWKG